MKKLMMAVLFAVGCFAANAEGDWRETCGKIVCLGGDTGLAGFVKRMAPDYMTGDFAESDRPEKKPFSANRNGYYDKALAWHGGYFNPTFHVRKQNPSGCWGFACRSSLHSRFRRVGSFA